MVSDWGIERRWTSGRDPLGEVTELETLQLAETHWLALLGPAGMGKSFEAERLAACERSEERDVRQYRLARAADPRSLGEKLEELLAGADSMTSIYLDALDESRFDVMLAEEELNPWLKKATASGARVRITCRSTDWPRSLRWRFESYQLQELSGEDARSAAERAGLDAADFIRQVEDAGGERLARKPLTLKMLLKLAVGGGPLPRTRRELFDRAVLALATEADERFQDGTNLPLLPPDLVEAAEYLSCCMALSGRFTVDLTDDPHPESLGWRDLAGLKEAIPRLEYSVLRTIGSSGLCDSEAENTFGFLHRQIPEYLAGRRIGRLLPHQARSLLAHPDGWRVGVAGPLRGAAAFAAAENLEVARWIADYDPEVIGLSDVQDQALRRVATRRLIERFRSGEMTGSQLYRRQLQQRPIDFRGLRYEGVEQDLKSVIEARGTESEDVLHLLAVMIEEWGLTSMSEELADVVMEADLPIEVRKSAGYALRSTGSEAARRRLKPLIQGVPEDGSDDLKGLALHCNWPKNLKAEDLFEVLAPPKRASYIGAYETFLYELAQSGFDFGEDPMQALEWSERCLSDWSSLHLREVAVGVLGAILKKLEDEEVAARVAQILLADDMRFRDDDLRDLAPANAASRRLLISALAAQAEKRYRLGALGEEIEGLVNLEDFAWLLEQAADPDFDLRVRENYVELAGTISWEVHPDCVRAWRRFCDVEPIRSKLRRSIGRNVAESLRWWGTRWSRRTQQRVGKLWRNRHRLTAPRPEREVRAILKETRRQPAAFVDLSGPMSASRRGGPQRFTRFLSDTPVWRRASSRLRRRIVSAAKRYLTASDITERCRDLPLRRLLPGIAAVWLLVEVGPEWLEHQPRSWWERWCWFMLRELDPRLTGEPEEPKAKLARMLHEHAPGTTRRELCGLAAAEESSAEDSLDALLEIFAPISDPELDGALCTMLEERNVAVQSIQAVARFLLRRGSVRGIEICRSRLVATQGEEVEERGGIGLAVAALLEEPGSLWEPVVGFVRRDAEVGREVIEEVARRLSFPEEGRKWAIEELPVSARGELLEVLLDLYPPESDPPFEGPRSYGGDDYAREWRHRLLSELSDSGDAEAVEVVRGLEARLGDRYPWLRRTRAHAGWTHRMALWQPLPLEVVDEVLGAENRRLLRSGDDVVEGIVAAVEAYERSLRLDGPHLVGDLWDAPKKQTQSPKDEEDASRKICGFIRQYFSDYAVAANREVEIRRRSLPEAAGGVTGSELDVLVDVPARGTITGAPIQVPIEVKLSSNDEVKTAMRAQLVERYVDELHASDGVYVVVWMDIPERSELKRTHRPKWPDLATARTELDEQAAKLGGDDLNLRAVVLDASLR